VKEEEWRKVHELVLLNITYSLPRYTAGKDVAWKELQFNNQYRTKTELRFGATPSVVKCVDIYVDTLFITFVGKLQ